MTDKLYLAPAWAGYATTPPQNEVLRVALDGGAGRYRADVEGASSIVDVQWVRDETGWQYASAFFRNRTSRGAEPFLVDLLLEGAGLEEYTAYFVPGSFRLTGARGSLRTFAAQFEVLPLDEDAAADSSLVDIWEASDGHPEDYLNGFAAIIAAWPT